LAGFRRRHLTSEELLCPLIDHAVAVVVEPVTARLDNLKSGVCQIPAHQLPSDTRCGSSAHRADPLYQAAALGALEHSVCNSLVDNSVAIIIHSVAKLWRTSAHRVTDCVDTVADDDPALPLASPYALAWLPQRDNAAAVHGVKRLVDVPIAVIIKSIAQAFLGLPPGDLRVITTQVWLRLCPRVAHPYCARVRSAHTRRTSTESVHGDRLVQFAITVAVDAVTALRLHNVYPWDARRCSLTTRRHTVQAAHHHRLARGP